MTRSLLVIATCLVVAASAFDLPGAGAIKPLNWTLLNKNLTKELPSVYKTSKFNVSAPGKNWTALAAKLNKSADAPKKLNGSFSWNPPNQVWNVSVPGKLTANSFSSIGGGGGGGINNKTKVINGVVVQTTGFPLNKTALEIALGKPFKNVTSVSGDFSVGGGGGGGFNKNKTIQTSGLKLGDKILVPAKNVSFNVDGGGGFGGGLTVTSGTPK